MRISSGFSMMAAFGALFSLGVMAGCAGGPEEEDDEALAAQNLREHAACGLTGLHKHDQVRACDPANTKKTTICHVPPGNPANAHTLCIGNAAVKHHLRNHPDYLGPCKRETPCPPPPSTPDAGAGAGGSTGAGGSQGAGGATGSGGTPGSGGAPAGSGGTGGGPIIVE